MLEEGYEELAQMKEDGWEKLTATTTGIEKLKMSGQKNDEKIFGRRLLFRQDSSETTA